MIELYVCVATMFTKDIWEAAIGEELPCKRETRNTKDDRYAVAVTKFRVQKYSWSHFNCEYHENFYTVNLTTAMVV